MVRLDKSVPDECKVRPRPPERVGCPGLPLTGGGAWQGARILIKLEMQNPGGSVKDRIAKNMIEQAEKEGKITPGKTTLVEWTSGNTGIGLAMIAAAKGYRCILVMPQLPPFQERYIICRQFGAEVHLTMPAKGVPAMKEHAERLCAENADYFLVSQFYNEANPAVHFAATGPELWEQARRRVDYFVAGVGTGGTINGAGKFLKQANPALRVVVVEPTESRVLVGEEPSPHTILGIGAGIRANFIEQLAPGQAFAPGPRGLVDEFACATSEQAVFWAKELARKEGIMVGPSSGAAVKVAMDLAQRPEARGKTIVVLCASHGIRYTSHPLWKAAKEEAAGALPVPPNLSKEGDILFYKSTGDLP
eukprot:scaffold2325_cov374-Prasinococcus_capsulatus_cf.AAC.1